MKDKSLAVASSFPPKIAFIQKRAFEKVSIHFLAGALREHAFKYDLFIADLEENFFSSLCHYQPDFIIFSLFIGEEKWALSCLQKVKLLLPETKILVGGPFALIFPEIINNDEIDYLFRGDGEYVLPKFIHRILQGEDVFDLPGISSVDQDGTVQQNTHLKLVNVAEVPKPDRDLYYKYEVLRNNPTKLFIAARGCPYRCTYCYNVELSGFFETPYWRQRKAEDVVEEIRYVKETYGMKWVHFQDGTFNADKKWLNEFLTLYQENDLPDFLCNCRVEHIDREIAKRLKQAGCDRITFGVQSGCARVRTTLAGRKMSNGDILNACLCCKESNIRIGVDVIFGWPGETLAEAMETIELCRKIDVENYSSNVLVFYPSLRITHFAATHGYIARNPSLDDIYKLNANSSLLLCKEKDIMINMDKLFYYLIRLPVLEPFLLFLVRLPPNRLYCILKNIHQLLRSMKYETNTSKWVMLKNYVKKSWTMDLY